MSNEIPPSDVQGLPFDDDAPLPSDVAAETPPVVEPVIEEPVEASVNEPTVTETDVDGDEEIAVSPFQRTGKNENAEMAVNPSSPLNPKKPFLNGEALYLLPCTLEELKILSDNVPRLDPTNSAQGAEWGFAVDEGRSKLPRGDRGVDALTRAVSLWRQSVAGAGEGSAEIGAGRPRLGDRTGASNLVGDEALQYMQAMMGTGQITRVPLWHSGIWVNLKAPTEAQLLELDRRIANEKILLGRISNGLAYSNTSVYLSSYLANFALAMVFDCSISGFTVESLKRKILMPDLPILLWGMLCTMYPSGYPYHRPCVADPTKCTHVVEELLNITKLCWTDNSALTVSQRNHMQRKTAKFTDIELTNYLSQHQFQADRTVVLKEVDGNKTVVELRVPTIADHEASGFAWVDGIVNSTDQAFGSQLAGTERNDYILDQARVTSLRQYAHWIERVSFNGQQYIEDRATLEDMISLMTGDQEAYTNFHKGVRKFIDASTISLVAIPYYTCPACGGTQHTEEEAKYPHLIPLDVQAIFFTLIGQRIQQLLGVQGI